MKRDHWKHSIAISSLVLLFVTVFAIEGAFAQGKNRDDIADKYKWNLEDIYPTPEAWHTDQATFAQRFAKMATFQGTLGKSASNLFKALDYIHNVSRDFDKLWVYAAMLSDQDTREPGPMAMRETLNSMWTTYSANQSYMEPEILAIPNATLDKFYQEEPKLEVYRRLIKNIQRMKPHTLSLEEEGLIAKLSRMSGIAENVHNILSNAEVPYEQATFSDGQTLAVDVPTYARYRGSANRDDRMKAFNAFFTTLGNYQRTFGALLLGQIKENLAYKEVRNYDTVLDLALYPKNIPTSVYTSLIEGVHDYLPYLQRYLKIKKRMLGVDELHYYDFYPDLVPGVELTFTYPEAQKILKNALKKLGKEYGEQLDVAFNNRWIDVYPSTGKASGAYSNGAYDTHPYVKLNYNDRFPDMSMLAHELGHAIHSYYADKTQPYPLAGYSSFNAEIAATVNEALLIDHVIQTIDDPKEKLALLGSFVEAFRTTVFRQTLFAEFEMVVNEKAENGESLSGERFSEIYLNLLKKYYGHAEGASVIDDQFGHEWAFISHFFLRYYNYQYATSYAASLAIAEKMETGGKEMVKRYIDFLSAGGSDAPITLLQNLGIDMTTNGPFELAMARMKTALDEMERILSKMEK